MMIRSVPGVPIPRRPRGEIDRVISSLQASTSGSVCVTCADERDALALRRGIQSHVTRNCLKVSIYRNGREVTLALHSKERNATATIAPADPVILADSIPKSRRVCRSKVVLDQLRSLPGNRAVLEFQSARSVAPFAESFVAYCSRHSVRVSRLQLDPNRLQLTLIPDPNADLACFSAPAED